MRIPRHAVIAIAFAGASTATAFTMFPSTITARTFVSRASLSFAPSASRLVVAPTLRSLATTTTTTSRSVGLNMIFGKFFGGGAFEAGIDYPSLDHPGPELAKAAEEGRAVLKSQRDPNFLAATFAGGCFWGLELAYQRVPGVVHSAVGYTQGREEGPTYSQVCAGSTGHTEAVIVYYDPKEVSYETLLDTFFGRVNPTTVNGQGNDFGTQYRTGVYFHSKEQEEIARARFEVEKGRNKNPIATELKPAMPFWPAEKYHQQYLEKGGQKSEKGAEETIRCYG